MGKLLQASPREVGILTSGVQRRPRVLNRHLEEPSNNMCGVGVSGDGFEEAREVT